MAEVFEAELVGELGFVRKVALKRMLEDAIADPTAAQRFLDEAVIASRLHHANVISVLDLGTLDDRPFQILEYVDGIDCQRLLQRAGNALPPAVALAIAGDVAHALAHAHAAVDAAGLPLGIVHRDVKPSNVLVSWSGDVKLGDFGIAVARDRGAATEAGVVAGTAGFIAPEQRTRGSLDGRTDVFALGLTLHALLAGYSPLRDLEIEIKVIAGDPVPIDPALPADVHTILKRALALRLADRPTASELATQLGAALARLAGDRRTLLRDFLAPHAPATTKPRGALDALLGIEVVATGQDGERRYETRAAKPPDAQVQVAASPASREPAPPSVSREPDPASREPSPRSVSREPDPAPRSARRLGLIALGGLVIAGGVVVWQLRGSSSKTDTTIATADARVADRSTSIDAAVIARADMRITTEADPTQPLDAEVIAIADAGMPADAVATPPVDAAVVAIADAVPPVRDARFTNAANRRNTIVDATIAKAPATGYVQVLGEALIGAAVVIDGKHAGSVPNPIAVTIGAHRIEIVKRDGTRLPAKTVEVTPMHNRANPARPTW